MNKADTYIYEAIKNILENGFMDKNPRPKYSDGSSANTLSVNHVVRTYDISKGEFPITTLRQIAWKSAIKELLWIYKDGSNDLSVLNDKYSVHYWNDWNIGDGTIGKRYGYVVNKYDLTRKLINDIKTNPYGRRHIISLWDEESFIEDTKGLAPCAFLTDWNVRNDGNGNEYIDMILFQRSGDLMCASCSGVNEVQYTAFLMMIAQATGYKVGKFTHIVANEQLYTHHLEQAKEMIRRYEEKEKEEYFNGSASTPKIILNTDKTDFFEFTIDDFEMIDYNPIKPNLKLELAV